MRPAWLLTATFTAICSTMCLFRVDLLRADDCRHFHIAQETARRGATLQSVWLSICPFALHRCSRGNYVCPAALQDTDNLAGLGDRVVGRAGLRPLGAQREGNSKRILSIC